MSVADEHSLLFSKFLQTSLCGEEATLLVVMRHLDKDKEEYGAGVGRDLRDTV